MPTPAPAPPALAVPLPTTEAPPAGAPPRTDAAAPPAATPAAGAGLVGRLELHGPEGLQAPELLALALGAGPGASARASVRAQRLLERVGGTRRLAEAGPGELALRAGLPRSAARRLVAALALGRRMACQPLEAGQSLCSTGQVVDAYGPRLQARAREQFVALLLDARNRVLREEQVSVGTLTASLVHPREVFAAAIREGAASVILLHNHPSGDPEPSADDEAVTRRLVAVGELVGIPVLDHLVLGRGRYVSMLERGLVPAARPLPPA